MDMPRDTSERIRSGDIRAISRTITRIDNRDPSVLEVLRLLNPATGNSHIIGITGPSGSGKSTLVDKIIREYRLRGEKVGVLAVDPTSPFSGGALLGDRIRMQSHATDTGVFIRSFATRGHLGGLSESILDSARVLDAAGFPAILIETVGVGQSEIDIVRLADTVVLVSVPGLGDGIQAIKAGIMEIGDIFVVNKADLDGADQVVRELRSMLETRLPTRDVPSRRVQLSHHIADAAEGSELNRASDIPPILKTSTESGEGIVPLVDALENRRTNLWGSDLLRKRRTAQAQTAIRQALGTRLLQRLDREESRSFLARLSEDVADKKRDVHEVLDLLTERFY